MSYITNADIQQRLGPQAYIQLTDDAGSGSASEEVVNEARIAAETEIDSHLAARYRTPVNTAGEPAVAAVLAALALDLVSYRLHLRRPPVPPDVARRRDECLAWLAAVTGGGVHLPALAPLAASTSQGLVARIDGPPRQMTRDTLDAL